MASATGRGYEYPTSGDDVGDLPAKVQELAESVDAQLKRTESGTAVTASTASGTAIDVTITFAAAFAAAPVCLALHFFNASDPAIFSVSLKSRSTTGCVFRVKQTSGGAIAMSLMWLAIG